MQWIKNWAKLIVGGFSALTQASNTLTNHLVVMALPLFMHRLEIFKNHWQKYTIVITLLLTACAACYLGLGWTFLGTSPWMNAIINHLLTYTGLYYTLGLVYEKYCDEKAWETMRKKQQIPIAILGIVGMLLTEIAMPATINATSKLLLSAAITTGLIIHFTHELAWMVSLSTLGVVLVKSCIGLFKSRYWLLNILTSAGMFPAYLLDRWIIALGCLAFTASKWINFNTLLSKDLTLKGMQKKALQLPAILLTLSATWVVSLPIFQAGFRTIVTSVMAMICSRAATILAYYPVNYALHKLAPSYQEKLVSKTTANTLSHDKAKRIIDSIAGFYTTIIATASLVYYYALTQTNSIAYTATTALTLMGGNYVWYQKAPEKWKKTALEYCVPKFMRAKSQAFDGKDIGFMTKYIEVPMYATTLALAAMNFWLLDTTNHVFIMGYNGSSISAFDKVGLYSLSTSLIIGIYMNMAYAMHILADNSIKKWAVNNKIAGITSRMPRWQYCYNLSCIMAFPLGLYYLIKSQVSINLLKIMALGSTGVLIAPVCFGVSIILERLLKYYNWTEYYNKIDKNNTLAAISIGLVGFVISFFTPYTFTNALAKKVTATLGGWLYRFNKAYLLPIVTTSKSIPSKIINTKPAQAHAKNTAILNQQSQSLKR